MLFDMMGKELFVFESYEVFVFGVVVVVLYVVGKIDFFEEVKDWIDIVYYYVLNKENMVIYLEMFYMYE